MYQISRPFSLAEVVYPNNPSRSEVPFANYNDNDQVKEDEIGRACSMTGVEEEGI
jgi:hypothetical protein